jgi:hypothetical protein
MKHLRAYATPLTIGTFLIMGATGILLFFHTNTTLNKVVHEYVGLVMVAAVILHVVLNWRAFQTYFKRPVALTLMGASAVMLAASFVSLGEETGGTRPDMVVLQMVSSASLTDLAPIMGTDAADLVARLAEQGVTATPDQTLIDLSNGDMRGAITLLSAVKG